MVEEIGKKKGGGKDLPQPHKELKGSIQTPKRYNLTSYPTTRRNIKMNLTLKKELTKQRKKGISRKRNGTLTEDKKMKIWGIFEKSSRSKKEYLGALYKTREIAAGTIGLIAREEEYLPRRQKPKAKIVKTNDNQLTISWSPQESITFLLKEIKVQEKMGYLFGELAEEIIKEI